MTDSELPGLVYWGQASLMQPQPAVSPEEFAQPQWSQRIELLAQAMSAYGGIGIAAPQIGWAARVFCFGIADENSRYPDAQSMPLTFWVNPRIETSSGNCWAWEGCLSVPGLRGWVARPQQISVSGLDQHGQPVSQTLDGFAARVFQHEMDHLDGVLMPMRIVDPTLLLSNELMETRHQWQEHWPSPGAFATPPGVVSPIR